MTDTFCVLPWIHLATHPIGVVTPCCISDMKDGASDSTKSNGERMFLGHDKLPDIANSDKFKSVRKDMMEGKEPHICRNCYFYEKNKVGSKRSVYNHQFRHLIEQCFPNTNSDGSLKKLDYRYIELRLGTVCNLKCVTCNSYSSSKWNEDTPAFYGTKFQSLYPNVGLGTPDMQWYRNESFYDELFNYCGNLEEIWINGGEPTLIKEHGYFLQKFIDNGTAENIRLHYSLNCTAFPKKFIDQWLQFKHVKIHLSVDDIGKRNSYIRYPSNWNLTLKNINLISEYKDNFELELLQTVSCLNIANVNEYKKFSVETGLRWVMNFVHYPDHLAVHHIPEELKSHIVNNLQGLTEEEETKIKVELLQDRNIESFDMFKQYINLLDRKRGVKIYDALPEWKNYFLI